ncbi:MAG: hypothetical protein HZB43_10570 [candidate division Zixibacteria bacterium]|nr:hypothetical protein [candidate division Zixibacteria bacterium]
MNARRSVILLISMICFVSCSTTRRSGQTGSDSWGQSSTHLVAHSREVVWSTVQAYMAERKWPLAETNQDRGLIRSGSFQLDASRDYGHCRSGRRSAVSRYDAELTIELHRVSANGTNLTVKSRMTAISDTGRNSDCYSTGALEDELVAGIDSLVALWRK